MILVNVIVIYDSSNETSTYNCVQLFLNTLNLNINIKVTEFFLTKNYFYTGYPSDSDANLNIDDNINNIINELNDSDLLILASPVFNCDISSEMKLFLNKLSYYISNGSILLMNNKIGLSISIAAGAGLFHATKLLKRNFNSLGIKITFKFSKTLYETNWEDVSLKTKMKIGKEIFKLSYRILNLYNHKFNTRTSILSKISPPKKNAVYIKNNSNIIQINSWEYQPHLHRRRIQ